MTQTDNARTAQVGDTLPTLQRTTAFHNWNRYAAVNDEFVPIHMDDEAGKAAGKTTSSEPTKPLSSNTTAFPESFAAATPAGPAAAAPRKN